MTTQVTWLSMVGALLLIAAACGDDSGSNGTGGTAGTPSGDACSEICTSPCGAAVDAPPGEVQDCIDACDETSVYDGCESEVAGFLQCLESVDCDENAAASACRNQALSFAQCFGGFSL